MVEASSSAHPVTPPRDLDDDPDIISKAPNRIRYADDVEAQRRRSLRRRDSTESALSARTSRSFARREVEPGVALPIQFRTLYAASSRKDLGSSPD